MKQIIAIVGRPNVGKSSFINRLIGQERLIVTPVAGTTRDSVDTPFQYEGQDYILFDTAGLRRKYNVVENIEIYTNLRTDRAISSETTDSGNSSSMPVIVDSQSMMPSISVFRR